MALISAFASDADLYILDEPTSGLDPLMEKVFQDCVIEVKKQGKCVLLSSHILQEVERLCDKVSIIRSGKIVDSGTMEQLRHLTRTSVKFTTQRPVEGLKTMQGVHDVHQENSGELALSADSHELGTVISNIAQYGILKLESSPPTLEELFMSHYETEGGNGQ